MKRRDLVDLLLLAALWGASFLFMRVAAPAFGPLALVEVRVIFAALLLLPLLALRGGVALLRQFAGPALAVGVFNSALPFGLITYGLLTLSAGFASILNAVTPMWTALIAWLWLRERIRPLQGLGLVVGVIGVTVLVWGRIGLTPGGSDWSATLAVAAALLATFFYGASANFVKRSLGQVPPLVTAAGSQVGAALAVAPFALWQLPPRLPGASAWIAALILGVACTGFAYLLYFRLLQNIGAMRAASVTFLIPVFGTAWGALLLGEAVTLQMICGGIIILLGTAMALGLLASRSVKSVTRAPRTGPS
jgi:drug/metabolite transporter (DMT)-like permease